MKVSKLFHWLYAFLMLLPIFAIGSVVLVNTFNAEAKNETNIIYKYETNDVNSLDDLKDGNIYHFNNQRYYDNFFPGDLFSDSSGYFSLYSYEIFNIETEKTWIIDETYEEENGFNVFTLNNEYYFSTKYYQSNNNDYFIGLFVQDSFIEFDFVFSKFQYEYLNSEFSEFEYFLSCFSKCENVPIERVEQKNISNVFYDSLEQVKNSSVFSWAMNSFLVTPFSFIVGLFGMPTNSIIVLLLSYWLDVAIIWLVFDLVMYVPQLVHRWIDKGMLE